MNHDDEQAVVPVHIREATRADVPAIVALLADDDLGQHREDHGSDLSDGYWAAFDAIAADPAIVLAVAEDAGVVVGTLQLTFTPHLAFRGGWRAQIEAVRTAADRRGQGLGRQLVRWAVEEARRRDCHLIQLTTHRSRDDARRFYESLGFEATHVGMKRYLQGDVTGR